VSIGTVALLGLQVAAVLAVGWFASSPWARLRLWEWPERALFSIVGFAGFAWVLMLGNLLGGGAVFGAPWPVPAAAAMVAAAGLYRGRARLPAGVPWLRLALAAAVLLLLYVGPGIVGGSGLRTGDPPWHLGWTEQLLAGERVPSGPAPEFGRNAYPWGFHALLATATRLVPSADPVLAHEATHVLIVVGIPLAAACLARRVEPRAGWPAAALVSLVGGFGWISTGRPAFFPSPRSPGAGADLVVASPNSVYELLPPAFPRELGLVLLGAAAVLLLDAARSDERRDRLAAGATVGLAGLVSLPMFLNGAVWLLCAAIVAPARRRVRLGETAGAAFVILLPWALPAAIDHARYGGFVNVTPRLGVEWPIDDALWSWGLLLPAAIVGVWLAARSREASRLPLLACAAGTAALLLVAVLRGHYDWGVAGNATLLHQGRVWPVAHLLAAVFGALALLRLAGRWRGRAGAAVIAALLTCAAVSPVFASIHLTRLIREEKAGFVFGSPQLERGAFLRRAAAHLSADDVVEVEDSEALAFLLFAFSGARLASFDDPRAERNDLRIRFADLAEAWDERMRTAGFDAGWRVLPADEVDLRRPVELGWFAGRRWALIRER